MGSIPSYIVAEIQSTTENDRLSEQQITRDGAPATR
jgi:hypothetical protein